MISRYSVYFRSALPIRPPSRAVPRPLKKEEGVPRTTEITGESAVMAAFSTRMERLTLTAAAGETVVRTAGKMVITA